MTVTFLNVAEFVRILTQASVITRFQAAWKSVRQRRNSYEIPLQDGHTTVTILGAEAFSPPADTVICKVRIPNVAFLLA